MAATTITIAATERDASVGLLLSLAWRARAESADSLAQRVIASEEAFEMITPAESTWIDAETLAPVSSDLAPTAEFISKSPYTDETGSIVPGRGYIFRLFRSTLDKSLPSPEIEAWVGSSSPLALPNTLRITLKGGGTARRAEEFGTTAAAVLQALVEIWEPDVAFADTTDQGRATFTRRSTMPGLGAVSWFSDQFEIPERVPGAAVIPFSNGTLVALGSTDAASTDPEDAARVHGYLVAGGFLHEPELGQPG